MLLLISQVMKFDDLKELGNEPAVKVLVYNSFSSSHLLRFLEWVASKNRHEDVKETLHHAIYLVEDGMVKWIACWQKITMVHDVDTKV